MHPPCGIPAQRARVAPCRGCNDYSGRIDVDGTPIMLLPYMMLLPLLLLLLPAATADDECCCVGSPLLLWLWLLLVPSLHLPSTWSDAAGGVTEPGEPIFAQPRGLPGETHQTKQ